MIEKLRELLRKKKEEVAKDMESIVAEQLGYAKQDVNKYFDALEETAKIVLPVNLLDILAKGGHVSVWKHHTRRLNELEKTTLHCMIGGDVVGDERILLEGKRDYRIVVIVEKLGEKKED